MRPDISQSILAILGLEDAALEEQDAALDRAAEEALMAMFQRIEERLPQDKREELYNLFETQTTDQEKAAFFALHAPDASDILMEEITRIKQEALAKATHSGAA